MNKSDPLIRLVQQIAIFLLVLLVVAISLAYWCLPNRHGAISMEIFKSTLQFAFVAGLGAVLASLFRRLENKRKEEAEAELSASREYKESQLEQKRRVDLRAEFIQRFLQTTGKAYRAVKSSRRQLRAAGLTSKYEVPPKVISEFHEEQLRLQMRRINTVQLVLEGLKKEVSFLPQFRSVEQLGTHFRAMESYLRRILSEFEKWSGARKELEKARKKNGQNNEFLSMKRLDEFTGEHDDSGPFETNFASRYQQVLEVLGQELRRAESEIEEPQALPDAAG